MPTSEVRILPSPQLVLYRRNRLYSPNRREVVFSETELPVYGVLRNLALPRSLRLTGPGLGHYHTVCAAIRSPAQRRAVATTRRSVAVRTAWAIQAPITTPTAATSPTAVPRTKSTEP
jgi:hypothetical protein